jgi:hypothetical protein
MTNPATVGVVIQTPRVRQKNGFIFAKKESNIKDLKWRFRTIAQNEKSQPRKYCRDKRFLHHLPCKIRHSLTLLAIAINDQAYRIALLPQTAGN